MLFKRQFMRTTIASALILIAICLGIFTAAPGNSSNVKTREAANTNAARSTLGDPPSPIRHLIVVVGENRSFDNVFGTYVPSRSQLIWNLLSQGIVLNNGAPGPNAALAAQKQATDTTTYQISPTQTVAFPTLPQPNTTISPALPVGPCRFAAIF